MTKIPEGVYTAHKDGDSAYIIRKYSNPDGLRCTSYIAVCKSTTEPNFEFAELIADYLNKQQNWRHAAFVYD